jgi:DNA polymerase I-like protein with 3'-5' exonuclease and polymerase domains
MANKNYNIVKTQQGLKEALIKANEEEFVAFDTETTGLNVRTAKVVGLSFTSFFDEGTYIVFQEFNPETQTLNAVFPAEVELKFVKDLCKILRNKKLIMHNAIFDVEMMRHYYGEDLLDSLYADTQLMKHTIDENRPFGLKEIAKRYQEALGIPAEEEANKEQLELKEAVKAVGGSWTRDNKEMYKAPVEILGKYGAADADLTLRVFDHFDNEIHANGFKEFFYDREIMPLLREGTAQMVSKGIRIDVDYFKELKTVLESDIIKLEKRVFEQLGNAIDFKVKEILDKKVRVTKTGLFAHEVLEYYKVPVPSNKKTGKPTLAKSALQPLMTNYPDNPALRFVLHGEDLPEDVVYAVKRKIYLRAKPENTYIFNLSSPAQLAWLLFEHFNQEPVSYSRKTDKASTDQDALEHYDLPFIPDLIQLKKQEKLLSSYVKPICEKEQDGWLYPEMLQWGTTSGRYSCAGGLNLQTLPRGDTRIKKGFICPEGYKVVSADFSSLEPRVFAWVSEDPGLKWVYQKGLDLYSQIAIEVFGLTEYSSDPKADNYLKKVNEEMRDKAKVFTLAVVYGSNAWRIAQLMKIDPKEAQVIIDTYLEIYPKLKDYMYNSENSAIKHGIVKTKFGRVRHLPRARDLARIFHTKIWNKRAMINDHGEERGSS